MMFINQKIEVFKRNMVKRNCDILLEYETGRIKTGLCEDQIEKVSVRDKVKISAVYVTEFKGELQLNIPRKGSIRAVK